MRFNLISNWNNGCGLQRDGAVLKQLLQERGHQVNMVMWKQTEAPLADVNVFVEVVSGPLLRFAPQQWAVPNPEWWLYDAFLPNMDRILAKTQDCFRIFSEKVGARCSFLGWKALDWYDPAIPRKPRFLHVAGKSLLKNTAALLKAWSDIPYGLTVVSRSHRSNNRQITMLRDYVTDEEMKRLLNSHQFHILPAAYEGYGHALHESMGVDAVVITTDAPPMNEIGASYLVRTQRPRSVARHYLAPLAEVSPEEIRRTVAEALANHQKVPSTRQRFLEDEQRFISNFEALLCSA